MDFHKFRTSTRFISFGNKTEIFDEFGQLAYLVKGNPFRFRKKYTLIEANGQTRYTIQQKGILFNASYLIKDGHNNIAYIKVPFSVKTPTLYVQNFTGQSFTAEGNFWGNNYKFKRGDEEFGIVSSSIFKLPGNYGIVIKDGEDIPLILCVVMVISMIKRRRNN